jgi:dihydrofolate reductase
VGARQVSLVWAQANGGVIGRDNTIPWHVPEDMAYFKKVTQGHPVVMGRKTWDSLPAKFRPLPGRRNIVVTRQPDWMAEGAETASGLASALALTNEDVCIMGGGEIYNAAMSTSRSTAMPGHRRSTTPGTPRTPVSGSRRRRTAPGTGGLPTPGHYLRGN